MPKVYSLDPVEEAAERLQYQMIRAAKEKKLSQEDLGNVIGMTQQAYSYKIEHMNFSYRQLVALFAVLGLTLETKRKEVK